MQNLLDERLAQYDVRRWQYSMKKQACSNIKTVIEHKISFLCGTKLSITKDLVTMEARNSDQ
jgi:hypothetical protein